MLEVSKLGISVIFCLFVRVLLFLRKAPICLHETLKLYIIRAMFFNRGSAEPLGSASGCQGFRRNRPKLPGTKFATTVLCGCCNIDTWIIVLGSVSNANIYGRFPCSEMVEKHCIRLLLNSANR